MGIANVRAPEVWERLGVRGEGIVVANVDSGVDFTHDALVNPYRGNLGSGRFDHDYNWYDPTATCGAPPAAVPCDNYGHGTHTMGTIVGDDGAGNQIGMAPAARWIAAKGCEGRRCTIASLLRAGQWILAPTDLNGQNPRPELRPQIVNNSWGGPADDFYVATVGAWVEAGIFPVFSAGNWRLEPPVQCGSMGSPADAGNTYAVGAYDINHVIADFSVRGPSLSGLTKPDIVAPGVAVRSSLPGNTYLAVSGTSMAAPHVAGAVALLWSAAPALRGDLETTRALLGQSAVDVTDLTCGGSATNNNVWGQGRLDVLAAVEQAPRAAAGTLTGTVTSVTDGAPLAGALVRAHDESGGWSLPQTRMAPTEACSERARTRFLSAHSRTSRAA